MIQKNDIVAELGKYDIVLDELTYDNHVTGHIETDVLNEDDFLHTVIEVVHKGEGIWQSFASSTYYNEPLGPETRIGPEWSVEIDSHESLKGLAKFISDTHRHKVSFLTDDGA